MGKEHDMRRVLGSSSRRRAALVLTAFLLAGCGGAASPAVSATPQPAQQTVEAAPVAAAQATSTAQAAADTRSDATLAPQLTATAQRQLAASSVAPPAATSTPVAASPAVTLPAATPEATPAAAVSTAAATADFAHWPVATPGGADPARERYDAATGGYTIALTATDHAYVHWQYAPEPQAYGDFTLDVDGQAQAGPTGGSWGVLFRAQPQRAGDKTNAGYEIIVTPGKQQLSVNWTSAAGQGTVLALATVPAMHDGDVLNHVHLVAQGNRLTVAVNGQTVGSATGPSTTPGALGLIVLQPSLPAGSSGMAVVFSHLVVAPAQ